MSGIKKISGLDFYFIDGEWVSKYSDMEIKLAYMDDTKCFLYDPIDGSTTPFKTFFAAMSFAKRKRYGRTLEEHERAEFVQATRERMGWSVKEMADKIDVSPRTIEAWSSGARAVPKIVIITLNGIVKIEYDSINQ